MYYYNCIYYWMSHRKRNQNVQIQQMILKVICVFIDSFSVFYVETELNTFISVITVNDHHEDSIITLPYTIKNTPTVTGIISKYFNQLKKEVHNFLWRSASFTNI